MIYLWEIITQINLTPAGKDLMAPLRLVIFDDNHDFQGKAYRQFQTIDESGGCFRIAVKLGVTQNWSRNHPDGYYMPG